MTGYPVTVYRWKVTRHNLYINFSPTIVAHIISYALCGELLCDHNYGDRFYANVVAHEIIADYMIFILAHITSLRQQHQRVAPSQNHIWWCSQSCKCWGRKVVNVIYKIFNPIFHVIVIISVATHIHICQSTSACGASFAEWMVKRWKLEKLRFKRFSTFSIFD